MLWGDSNSMAQPTDRERVSAFITRCRRVMASPFAQDFDDRFSGQLRLEGRSDGGVDLLRWKPDEARLESVLARMRPLFLEKDTVNYNRSLDSIARLVGWGQAELDGMRERWNTVVDGMRYEIGWRSMETGELQTWTDRDGAKAFIYGDLVHGDHDKPDAGGLEERFLAAYQLVLGLLEVVQYTLGVLYAGRTLLGLEEDPCWSAAVSVGPAGWVRKEGGRAYQAPLGSAHNVDPAKPMGADFKPFPPDPTKDSSQSEDDSALAPMRQDQDP